MQLKDLKVGMVIALANGDSYHVDHVTDAGAVSVTNTITKNSNTIIYDEYLVCPSNKEYDVVEVFESRFPEYKSIWKRKLSKSHTVEVRADDEYEQKARIDMINFIAETDNMSLLMAIRDTIDIFGKETAKDILDNISPEEKGVDIFELLFGIKEEDIIKCDCPNCVEKKG